MGRSILRIVSETELRYLARGASYEWLRQAFKRNDELFRLISRFALTACLASRCCFLRANRLLSQQGFSWENDFLERATYAPRVVAVVHYFEKKKMDLPAAVVVVRLI